MSESRSKRKSGRPTVRDVARIAGVSAITVSRALRDASLVSGSTRQKVDAAVARLGYITNRAAGSLAGARSNIVPVLVPRVHNAFFSETIEAIAAAFAPAGLDLMIGVHGYDLERERGAVRALLTWNPAAFVLAGTDHLPATRRLLREAGIPVVEMWDLTDRPIGVAVGFSHEAVGAAIGDYARRRGFRRPGFIGAFLDRDLRARRRLEGFRSAFVSAGIEPQVVAFDAPASVEHGVQGMERLLALSRAPDLVCCSNDVIALGVLFQCQRRGIAVPDTVSVIGFGDLPASRECVPRLTSVRPRGARIGQVVAEEILARLGARDGARWPRLRDTGFEIVERDSVRATPARRAAAPAGSRGADGAEAVAELEAGRVTQP